MIAFDVQALQSPAYAARGIGRYVADLVRTLEHEHPGIVDVYVHNDHLPDGERLTALAAELDLGERLRPASSLRGLDVDVLHLPAPFAPLQRADDEAIAFTVWMPPVRARALVLTVHDLIPWHRPDVYLPDPRDLARYHHRLAMLPTADVVITDSEAVARDVVAMAGVAPHRVVVGGAGVSDRFRPPTVPRAELLAELHGTLHGVLPEATDGFVLAVGAPDWRKNLEGAIAAYARLPAPVRAAHPLVIAAALDGHAGDAVRAQAAELGVADLVVTPGFLDDDTLVALYQAASVVIVPSRLEGFGLPVAEARACGARTICADASSLVEVLPDRSARFDPDDVGDMAATLEAALTDPAYQAVLDAVPAGPYSWSLTAERTVDAYRRALRRHRTQARGTGVVRIGVATHVPPAPTGIADHSAHLVAALAGLPGVEVEVFTPAVPHRLVGAPHVPVRHLAALAERWASGALDHVVYCIGNGAMHHPLAMSLAALPGAVLLHDVRLPYLFGRGADGTATIASRATIVLVQSAHAASMLRDATGIRAVDVGPHPCWDDGQGGDASDDVDAPPWIVSAGIAHEAKQTDRFVAAARLLVGRGAARAAVVGDGGERFVDAGEPIVTTGHVSGAVFDGWLRRAAVLVQLRAGSNGESSGVVAHALARGVPLVVTDIGAMAELPDDVAVKVPVDVTAERLADVVGALLADPDRRAAMRAAALAFAGRETATAQAGRIVEALAAASRGRMTA